MMVYEELDAVAIGQVPCPEYALGIGATPDDDTPTFDVIPRNREWSALTGKRQIGIWTPPAIIQAMEPELVVEIWEAIGCFTGLLSKENVVTIPPVGMVSCWASETLGGSREQYSYV
jgi:hypothetical protein